MKFYVIGSALHKKTPRDVDIVGVLEWFVFKSTFGSLTPSEFKENLRWKAECWGATRIIQTIHPELIPVDFQIIPDTFLLEPSLEVDMKRDVSTWDINFPDLTHG